MKLISDTIALIFLVLLVVWIGSIYMAPADQKAVQVCRPVHYAVNGVGFAVIAITGKQPEEEPAWKDQTRLWCLKTADRTIEAASK